MQPNKAKQIVNRINVITAEAHGGRKKKFSGDYAIKFKRRIRVD